MPPFQPRVIALALFAAVLTDQSARTRLRAVEKGNMVAFAAAITDVLGVEIELDAVQARQVADIMSTLGETTQGEFSSLFNTEVQVLIHHPTN